MPQLPPGAPGLTKLPPASLPLPLVRPESAAFWTGGRTGHLMVQHCPACDRFHHPPLPTCPNCQSDAVAPLPVSGIGTVVSFTLNVHAWREDMELPLAIAFVELQEQPGLWLLTNIVRARPDALAAGMRVRVVFEPRGDGIWLPLFEPWTPPA